MEELSMIPVVNELSTIELTKELIVSDQYGEKYKQLLEAKDMIDNLLKSLDEKTKQLLQNNYMDSGEQKWENAFVTYTFVPGSVRENFDAKALKADDPDTYAKYAKTSAISPSMRVKKK